LQERRHEGPLTGGVEPQQREQTLGHDARLGIGREGLEPEQRDARVAPVARDRARRGDPHGRLRIGQQLREQREHVAAAGLGERERGGAAQVDCGVDAPAEYRLHLHVARRAAIELCVLLAEAAQRLDDGRLGGAARVALRKVGEEAEKRRHELGDERLELELRDERGGARHRVRALGREDAPQLGLRFPGCRRITHAAQRQQRLFERSLAGHRARQAAGSPPA